ncbi:GNAT family N-acetyltransferase [Pelomonas sp. SE-A7]|uniref:GNAT family N-acetyltransferase n=1 Tax=Pelomonas sp. SE-A7 TaxID=3054953 RepID=UPI00259CA5A4|nr:GNAT family N-acetyltransferase [Pelomonas sp. SE-A7]MDM4764609.1 GNAT family N-acetyltransferase [Pelomonas sp. SE-A7]
MDARLLQANAQAIRPELLRLRPDRAVLLRAITPQDAVAEQAFVGEGLSLISRHQRFHVGLPRLSPTLLRLMIEVDQREHVALVAQELAPSDAEASGFVATERIVADARFVRDPARPDEAEFALAVADAWQSLGLGRTLIARLATHARAQGIRALVGDVLADNRRMQVLMRGLGAQVLANPQGPQLVKVRYPV